MPRLEVTHHASVRMQQRGMKQGDVELMELYASDVGDKLFMTDADAQLAIQRLKKLIQSVSRLRGKALAISKNRICTAYHCNPGKEDRLLRQLRAGK